MFILIQSIPLTRGHIGEGEKAVVELFRTARRVAPSIVFIDEFQAVFTARAGRSVGGDGDSDSGVGSSLSSTLAGCIDDIALYNEHAGVESMVTVIAATNEPWAVDSGFLRPGRLDKVIFVGTLEESARRTWLENECVGISTIYYAGDVSASASVSVVAAFTRTHVLDSSDSSENEKNGHMHPEKNIPDLWQQLLHEVLKLTAGFTGADMALLRRRALLLMHDSIPTELSKLEATKHTADLTRDCHSDVSHSDVSHSDVSHSDVSHSGVSHSDGSHSDVSHSGVSRRTSINTADATLDNQSLLTIPGHILFLQGCLMLLSTGKVKRSVSSDDLRIFADWATMRMR